MLVKLINNVNIKKAQVMMQGLNTRQFMDLPSIRFVEIPQPDQYDLKLTIDNILVDETLRGNHIRPDDMIILYPEKRFKKLMTGEYHVPNMAERHDGDATQFVENEPADTSTDIEYIRR